MHQNFVSGGFKSRCCKKNNYGTTNYVLTFFPLFLEKFECIYQHAYFEKGDRLFGHKCQRFINVICLVLTQIEIIIRHTDRVHSKKDHLIEMEKMRPHGMRCFSSLVPVFELYPSKTAFKSILPSFPICQLFSSICKHPLVRSECSHNLV